MFKGVEEEGVVELKCVRNRLAQQRGRQIDR